MEKHNSFRKLSHEFKDSLRVLKNVTDLSIEKALEKLEGKEEFPWGDKLTKEQCAECLPRGIRDKINVSLDIFDKMFISIERPPVYKNYIDEFNRERDTNCPE